MKETSQADGKMQPTSAAYEQTAIGARSGELDRLKSHFLAAMRHELRAPVDSIIASTDLLARAGLSAEHSERIGSIRKNCNAIVRIIESSKICIDSRKSVRRTCSKSWPISGSRRGLAARTASCGEAHNRGAPAGIRRRGPKPAQRLQVSGTLFAPIVASHNANFRNVR